jgi:DNA-nicking Smr family endonuclease
MRQTDPLPGREIAEPALPPMTMADALPLDSQGIMPLDGDRLEGKPQAVTGHRSRLPSLDPTASPGLDRRTDDRLRRGRLGIQGRIDLHGMTQSQAHAALNSFILRGWHEQRRMVLVITGKGSGGQGAGILRQVVPRWLNESPLRPLVLAIQRAQPKDGGDGALYVLLKKRR